MSRGEVWTAADGSGYLGKQRPVVVLQDDRFDATDSITVCPLTTDPTSLPLFRVVIEPDGLNGLGERSSAMADKVATMRRSRLGERIGRLADDDMVRLGRAVLVFLGFGGG